jgi:hypothetical protein
VQHRVGASHEGALLTTQNRAACPVITWPAAKGNVEARLLEQGEVRDRQRRVAVLDEDARTAPGSAR